MINFHCFGQTHVEYISEKTDSMALINKTDVDKINKVFAERNVLDSLNNINEKIISNLEINKEIQNSIIESQALAIKHGDELVKELENRNTKNVEKYSKELKKERNKAISFEALTGAGIIAIILLILL
jgi:hypothetical protein